MASDQFVHPSRIFVHHCVTACCSVLQCVAVCCSALQCVAVCGIVCCSVLQCVAACCGVLVCYSVLQGVAVCSSVLQCAAVCCSVLQCVLQRDALCIAVCCRVCYSVLQSCLPLESRDCRGSAPKSPHTSVLPCVAVRCSALQCVAVRCSVLQCVAVCCSALQYVVVRCSALQCVAVRCSALQCVAVRCSVRCSCTSLLNLAIVEDRHQNRLYACIPLLPLDLALLKRMLRSSVGCQKAYIYSHTLRIVQSSDTFVRAQSARTRCAAQECGVSEGISIISHHTYRSVIRHVRARAQKRANSMCCAGV